MLNEIVKMGENKEETVSSTNSSTSNPVLPVTTMEKSSCAMAALFCNRFRFFVLILGTLCLTSVFSNMLTLNFTLICFDPNRVAERNESKLHEHPTHSYSQYEKTVLQWTVAIAAAVATFPFSYLCCMVV